MFPQSSTWMPNPPMPMTGFGFTRQVRPRITLGPMKAPGKTIEVPGGEITLPIPDVLVPDAAKPAPGAEPTAAPKLEDTLKDALLDTLFKQN